MRYSSDPTDPGYHPAFDYMTITLNGTKQEKVMEVDDQAGTVRIMTDFDIVTGRITTETRRGLIRIHVEHEHAHYVGWPLLPARYVGRATFKAPAGFRRIHAG